MGQLDRRISSVQPHATSRHSSPLQRISAFFRSLLVLQLRLRTPAVVSPTRGLVVTHAPNDPLEQKTLGCSAQKNSAGQEVADGIHSNTKLRRAVHEATLRPTGLLSFRLQGNDSTIEARNRSARSLARNAAAAITKLM